MPIKRWSRWEWEQCCNAVKTFCKELFKEGFIETVKREMSLHQRLGNKNIIKFYNIFEDTP